MSGRLHGTPLSSTLPASQNTAPVNEFRCLFTHDIRRKQKRWQDGYLKFHTFNNRVMVYDQARNFLGDTYWKEPSELQEGDELQLDKPVMVEVAEALGITQTDLTLLFDKKKDSPKSQSKSTVPKPRTTHKPMLAPTLPPPGTSSHLRHKSLNTLLGTPRGPIGKATPIESPFEARKKMNNHSTEERPTKRQKKVHDLVVSRGSSPSANLEPVEITTPSIVLKDSRTSQMPPRSLPRHPPVIDPDSDMNEGKVRRTPTSTPPVVSNPPKIPKGKVPVPSVKAMQTPKPPPRPSSPPISASNRITNIDYALQPLRKARIETESPSSSNSTELMEQSKVTSPPPSKRTKTLRLTTGVKRGMLLCQPVLQRQDPAPRQDEPPDLPVQATERKPKAKDKPRRNDADIIILDDDDEAAKLPSRSIPNAKNHKNTARSNATVKATGNGRKNPPKHLSETASDMEIAHGIMDQQLAVTPSPPSFVEIQSAESPPIPHPQLSKPPDTTISNKKRNGDREHDAPLDNPSPRKRAKTDASRMARTDSHQSTNVQPPRQLPYDGNKASGEETRQEIEANRDETCNEPASISHKEKPLSLGGFRKKSKRLQPLHVPDEPGPSATAKESPAVCSKPTKPFRVENDPIQDDLQIISPNRNFRRSRSENDAPIPSISEEWEKQNLPKPPPKSNGSVTDKAKNALAASMKPKTGGLAALVKRTDPRRKFQRTQSLNDSSVSGVIETSIVDLPPDDDVGPWSTEAFDLFDWRPPVGEGEDQGAGLLTDRR
ncbi:hypothetical protein DM02DRAFT_17264 [Periconia macrospinosa]|uniref:5'-3' DNA helicase ZGRF1-like N-terminal domain-containing protein n=1 Tax=Periconia macrospinosa TaxID=97972 RepID=A0A2V1E759_9PLEO|nr:hypothetical protein DM02DRAFT_17264 [Periconia macrospinosa]